MNNYQNYEAAKHNLVATPSPMQLALPDIDNDDDNEWLFDGDIDCEYVGGDNADITITDSVLDENIETNTVEVEYAISKKQFRADICGTHKDDVIGAATSNMKILTVEHVIDGFLLYVQDISDQRTSCAKHIWLGSREGAKIIRFTTNKWQKATQNINDGFLETVIYPQVVINLDTLHCEECEILFLVAPSIRKALYKLGDDFESFTKQREKKKTSKQAKSKKNKKKDKKFIEDLQMVSSKVGNADFASFMNYNQNGTSSSSSDGTVLFNPKMSGSMSKQKKQKIIDMLSGKRKKKPQTLMFSNSHSNSNSNSNNNNKKSHSKADKKLIREIHRLQQRVARLQSQLHRKKRESTDSESRSRSRDKAEMSDY